MKTHIQLERFASRSVLFPLWLVILFIQLPCWAQSQVFTYQGRLSDNGNSANGSYDFRFRLASDALGNNFVGGPILSNAQPVSSGLFMVMLDFGPGIFTGSNYWLQIDVKTNGAGSYATLTPLQALTPTPYAMFASGASNVLGIIPGSGLSGSYSSAVSFNNAGNTFNGSFSGNGGNVTNVNAASVGGISANGFWKTAGNSGTTVTNFIGTLDNQPLEFRINGQRALRLEQNVPDGPNVIGGYSNNFVGPGLTSATIAGGGHSGATNRITGAGFDGTIGGGNNNAVTSFSGTVAGGANNTAFENATTVGGGSENFAGGDHDIIAGGQRNVTTNSSHSVIGGGLQNTNESTFAVIVGGSLNRNDGPLAAIGGGEKNLIGPSADHATIAGGGANTIVGSDALPVYGTIGGGANNVIQTNTSFATVAGGISNVIQSTSHNSFIGGGTNNVIQNGSADCTIAGGLNNTVGISGIGVFVGGGSGNSASGNSATVAGGNLNVAGFQATIGGGVNNTASGSGGTVGGGGFNTSSGLDSTVPGGLANTASGNYSFAAGHGAQALNDGAFVWADLQSVLYSSDRNNQVKVRAAGGMILDVSGSSGLNPAALRVSSTSTNGVGIFVAQTSSDATAVFTAAGTGNIIKGFGSGGEVFDVLSNGVVNALSFNPTSDRNAKRNFTQVRPDKILDEVAALPISEWNYTADESTRHIGPMAQDFYAAFHVGTDDKHIATIDADGVALAAIQGLNQKVEELRTQLNRRVAENAELKQENDSLEKRLEALEKHFENRN